jgi:hypothetical protein
VNTKEGKFSALHCFLVEKACGIMPYFAIKLTKAFLLVKVS